MKYEDVLEELEAISIKLESYNDYPQSATNNAKRARKWKEENGSDCGTRVGWTRSSQLADRKPISRDTIARMASFKRHQQHKDVPYSEGCGGLMWDAWGGTSGVNWAINKLKQIDNNTETNHHHHHHNNNDDTLLTNLDGGFTIVKNKKKNRRDKQVSNTASNNDGMEQVQSKNKHNWLYARAMMLSKFQKAASIYKSNPARARMLADEGEQYRFMALQYRIEEADRIFYENNNELFQLNKNHLATYIKEPPVTKSNSGANITPIQIDLHGLHVTEGIYQVKCAIEMCEEHAAASTQIICSSSSKRKNKYTQKLIIVTGHGENRNNKTLTNTPSRSGKLYKNVRQFLKRKGMNFVEQKGSFEVLM